jgi:hypothetical protein
VSGGARALAFERKFLVGLPKYIYFPLKGDACQFSGSLDNLSRRRLQTNSATETRVTTVKAQMIAAIEETGNRRLD